MPTTPTPALPPAQAKALRAAGSALGLAAAVKAPFKAIAEGEGRSGRDRVYHWRVAYGSARELAVHLRLLAQAGALDRHAVERVLCLLDEVRAMLWRMTHPR